jgi:hypothetical protein
VKSSIGGDPSLLAIYSPYSQRNFGEHKKIHKSALASFGKEKEREGIPLVKWKKLVKTKENGGWGLMHNKGLMKGEK